MLKLTPTMAHLRWHTSIRPKDETRRHRGSPEFVALYCCVVINIVIVILLVYHHRIIACHIIAWYILLCALVTLGQEVLEVLAIDI